VRDELLSYYERELTFFRQMGAEFAEQYPKVASRLLLEPTRCEDPHVERLIEAAAFLAARVHLKIDDEFPEISESLLTVLYPHYIRPIPPMSIVQFHLDPELGKVANGLNIPRDSMLYSRPVEGYPCKFRTCYDTTIWPVTITDARWITPDRLNPPVRSQDPMAAALRLELSCLPDIEFTKMRISRLRIYLNGESSLAHTLYELLNNNCMQIQIRDLSPNSRKPPIHLDASSLIPVGFGREEAVLPYPSTSFVGYRLLQEYFTFPEKFLFLDLLGLEAMSRAGFGPRVEVIFLIKPYELPERQQMLELNVSASTLALNCSPIINLFPLTAEPILLDQRRFEYAVVPDVRRALALEVFSIDQVVSIDRDSHDIIHFEPFYRFRHASTKRERQQRAFWYASRKPSVRRNDEGTDVYVSLMDLTGRPAHPDFDTISIHTTCSNRDLGHRLPLGNPNGDFEIEGITALKKCVALRKPTRAVRPPWGKGILWRLISHLSLNYLSLVEEGREAFQEMLRLYNFTESPYLEKQIAGIVTLSSKRHFARVVSEEGIGFVRGRQVEILFDEEQFVGGGTYLFASVIEHFLGLYASLNSFSQLTARTNQRKEPLSQWQPRAGQAILL
jgi:type VI secretion system protein ImpG